MAAAKSILEPIFEADFLPCSFGFRPKRSAHQALEVVRTTVNKGATWALDADISDCFGSLSFDAIMTEVAKRVSDRKMLKLIRAWLRAGVLEGGVVTEQVAGAATPATTTTSTTSTATVPQHGLGRSLAKDEAYFQTLRLGPIRWRSSPLDGIPREFGSDSVRGIVIELIGKPVDLTAVDVTALLSNGDPHHESAGDLAATRLTQEEALGSPPQQFTGIPGVSWVAGRIIAATRAEAFHDLDVSRRFGRYLLRFESTPVATGARLSLQVNYSS